ncbi:coiled-coil domain-containing protein 74A-like isoform X2 [Symsagittifera roscoffensis]|uniref:coiled-coil domain-containing protein 74A-like isoform X2 n=1 Tax=Symsagittifera roscoffensis TaxID=84072 RepID=UPI00307B1FFA
MSIIPHQILEPIPFGNPAVNNHKSKPEIWHIRVDQQPVPHKHQQNRESPSKILQLENTIQFMNKQHNEVLQSLQHEIEVLKNKNRDLQFSALTSDDSRLLSNPSFHHVIPTGFGGGAGDAFNSTDSRRTRGLEEEVDRLKGMLSEQREQNKKLQVLIDGYKRSIPLTSSAKKDQLDRTPPSSASHHNTLTRRSLNASPIDDLASTSSKLLIEEALPFSLKPFVVHPPSEDDRTPSLNECQAIIAQLSFHCQNQHQELSELKQSLKDALYSQKWTPDAYLLAKAIVNDPQDHEQDMRPLSADESKKNRQVKIPDAVYSIKEHGSLPALRQTLQPGVIERQKKVHSMQKKRLRSYIVSKNAEGNQQTGAMMQPQPPPPPQPPTL